MNISRRCFLAVVTTGAAAVASPRAFAAVHSGLRPSQLDQAIAALDAHGQKIRYRDVLGLVDFSAPSGHPRFQIIDIENGRVLSNRLVAHGRGSDPSNTGWAQRFSNVPGSNASSRGSFLTGDAYYGKHGRSRRLHGLDADNDQAFSRAIVIHGADYVSRRSANTSGRVGRSLGCFTVSKRDISEVMSRLEPGRLLFAAR